MQVIISAFFKDAERRNLMLAVVKEIISESIADKKIRKNIKSYVFQSLLTFICVFIALCFHQLFGGIIVASLGASSFIIFITPHTRSSKTRCIIGGYICGAIAGILFSFLHGYISGLSFEGVSYALILVCAAAAALTTLLMITTGLVHPPAAALALGLASDRECLKTAMAAVIGVIILCTARRLLKKYVKDLI